MRGKCITYWVTPGNWGQNNRRTKMFKVVQDSVIDELLFKCAACGEEQTCYTDILPIIHCLKCHKVLKPSPFHIFHNRLYRIGYHFMVDRKEHLNDNEAED